MLGRDASLHLTLDLGLAFCIARLFLAGPGAKTEGGGERQKENSFHKNDSTELIRGYSKRKIASGAAADSLVVVRRNRRGRFRSGKDGRAFSPRSLKMFPLPIERETSENNHDPEHDLEAAARRAAGTGRTRRRAGQLHRAI